jgi:hypothetical protein
MLNEKSTKHQEVRFAWMQGKMMSTLKLTGDNY